MRPFPYRSRRRREHRPCQSKCGSAIGHPHRSRLLGQRSPPRRLSRSNLGRRTFHSWPDSRRRCSVPPGCRLRMLGLLVSRAGQRCSVARFSFEQCVEEHFPGDTLGHQRCHCACSGGLKRWLSHVAMAICCLLGAW